MLERVVVTLDSEKFERAFLIDNEEKTREKAQLIANSVQPFASKEEKEPFKKLGKKDLQKLIFVGPITAESQFGKRTPTEFAQTLADAISPALDRLLVKEIHFINTAEALTPENETLMLQFAAELLQLHLGHVKIYILNYDHYLQPSLIPNQSNWLIGQDSPGSISESPVQRHSPAKSREVKAESLASSTAVSGLLTEASDELAPQIKGLRATLDHEIERLKLRARHSCCTAFINFEISTKAIKRDFLTVMEKDETPAASREHAQSWMNRHTQWERARVSWGFRNTLASTWFGSRTKTIVKAVNQTKEPEMAKSKRGFCCSKSS